MSTPAPRNGKYHTQDDPAMDKYRPAWDSLKANKFVNDPELSDDDRVYLRGIQGTWKVRQEHWAERGHVFQLMLIWDHDRIWGAFDFGYYKGILMVDHGPQREPPQFTEESEQDDNDNNDDREEPEPIYHDFTWRGTCSQIPDTAINNSLITKGKIEFGSTWIRGYFEGMGSVGLPDGRCDFDGKALPGPRRVSRTLQSFLDDWNDLEYFGEDETIRQ